MNVLGVPENILKLAVSGKIQNDFQEHKLQETRTGILIFNDISVLYYKYCNKNHKVYT